MPISYYNFLNDFILGPTDKDQLDIQGDIAYDIVEFIIETWPNVIYSYHYHFIFDSVSLVTLALHFMIQTNF